MFLQRGFSGGRHGLRRKEKTSIQRPLIMKICFLSLISLALVAGGCNQNLEVVSSGERLEDSPKPVADPSARPLARAGDASGEKEIPPFVKAYFMHMWVEALYSKPQNNTPNPHWESPLMHPENGRVSSTACHTSGQIDFAKITKIRDSRVNALEKDREFLFGVVKKC